MAKIEFISYSGSYPTLCSGILLVRINGQAWAFNYRNSGFGADLDPEGYKAVEDLREKEEVFSADRFWSSGGCVYIDENSDEQVETGPWECNDSSLPEELRDLADELISVFNENVDYGCCGGCI